MGKQQRTSLNPDGRGAYRVLVYSLLAAAALGILARIVLAWLSEGCNDAPSFRGFGQQIDQHGLIWMYRNVFLFNHPPFIGYWNWTAWKLTLGTQPDLFAPVFKLPMIAADIGSAWLLWSIGLRRRGAVLGATMAAAFSWSLVAILVGAHHCNTDNLYAFISLLAVYLLDKADSLPGGEPPALATPSDEAPRPNFALLSGLALGAAINVKLIPILLIAPLFFSCRGKRAKVRFTIGLAVMALPFLPVVLLAWKGFYSNAIAYRAQLDRWGIPFLSAELRAEPVIKVLLEPVNTLYMMIAPGTILLLVAAASVLNWLRPRWSRAELCALCYAIFLILAPGFGVQYMVIIVPLLFAADLRFAALYSTLGGAFLFIVYYVFWTGGFPIYSYFDAPLPIGGSLIGLITWVLLTQWAYRLARRRRPGDLAGLPGGAPVPA